MADVVSHCQIMLIYVYINFPSIPSEISSDGCEGAEGAVHQELLALQGARKSYRTRSETASARVLVSTQESVRLAEQHSAVSAEIAAAAVQRDELQSTHQALVAKNQVT